MSISPKKLAKLSDPEYRRTYLKEMVTGWVVHQIKQLRQDRNWSQAELGERAGHKPQSTIARLESIDYGSWSTASLLELADAFDVAIDIRFLPWPTFVENTNDTSPAAMSVPSFSVEQFNPANVSTYSEAAGGLTISRSVISELGGGTIAHIRTDLTVGMSANAAVFSVVNRQDVIVPLSPIGTQSPTSIPVSV